MALRLLSDEKRRILDLERDAVVVAGAGSGKSTLLTRAVYEDVRVHQPPIPLERILVVAFNTAAANELVDRIQSEFAGDGQTDLVAEDLSEAWIGTFHAICGRIVRERAHAAGVAPDLVVLDQIESRILAEAALDDAVERAEHPNLVDMLAAISIDQARDSARTMLDRLRAAGDERPELRMPPEPALELGSLRAALQELIDGPRVNDGQRESARSSLDALEGGRWDGCRRLGLNTNNVAKPLCAAFNVAAEAAVAVVRDREARPLLEAWIAFFDHYRDAYGRLKHERGAVDFEDLQLLALRVLESDPRAQAAYRFERVYVDEAQDVNGLQDRLIRRLAGTRNLRVGDAQQSIYRFRWADVATFAHAADEVGRQPLEENYRSTAAILDVLNPWCVSILADQPERFHELVAKAGDGQPPAVELLIWDDAGAPAEARELAGRVIELHHEFGWGEIAILCRTRAAMLPIDRTLRLLGVPTVLSGATAFVEHDQVEDVLSLLELIENPRDEPALVRALGSPFRAASDDQLLALRQAAGEAGSLWEALQRGEVPALNDFRDGLAGLRAERWQRDLTGLVEAAIAMEGYELAALGYADGMQRHANLRRLVEQADRYASVRGGDLRGFTDFLRSADDVEGDPGEATVVDEDLDAVRLMTVHAAKGREFPCVVVANCGGRISGRNPSAIAHPDGRIGLRLSLDGRETSKCFDFASLAADESALTEAEERRVYYVALTRAMRGLVVSCRSKTLKSGERSIQGAGKFLVEAIGLGRLPGNGESCDIALGKGVLRAHSIVVGDESEATGPIAPPDLVDATNAPPAPIPPPLRARLSGRRLSYTSLELHGRCSLRFHLEVELAMPGSDVRLNLGEPPGGGGNRRFGILFHEAIEQVDWAAPDLVMPSEATPSERERAERLFAAVRDGEVGSRLRAAIEVRGERPFALELDGTIIEGVLDVWAREQDGTVLVVDWKTGAGGDSYALQRAVYALAALRSGAEAVDLAWCHLESGAVEGGRFGSGDVPALEVEVRAALAAVDGLPVAAVTEPAWVCVGCPGLRVACGVAARVAE